MIWSTFYGIVISHNYINILSVQYVLALPHVNRGLTKFSFSNLLRYCAALRRVIETYSSVAPPPVPSNNKRASYGLVKVSKIASFFEVLDTMCSPMEVVEAEHPIAMESVGQVKAICRCMFVIILAGDGFFCSS